MGTTAALTEARGLDAEFPPSRVGFGFAREESRSLLLARQAPRGPRYRAEEKDGLVRAILSELLDSRREHFFHLQVGAAATCRNQLIAAVGPDRM